MLIISHRGNLENRNLQRENLPAAIKKAISLGFDVEIDIFKIGKQLWLGHDGPKYKISEKFLFNYSDKLYIHCKSLNALEYLQKFPELNIFWHNLDEHVFTSKGNLITHINQKKTTKNGILVLGRKPNNLNLPLNCYGVITDWPILIKYIYEEIHRKIC